MPFDKCRALKKLNEKKQVLNMYKTQKAKEEKVRSLSTYVKNRITELKAEAIIQPKMPIPFIFFCRRNNDNRLRGTERIFAVSWKNMKRSECLSVCLLRST